MSIKIKRYQSNEAGPFDTIGGRTIANIEIPASVGFSDLHNSQVVFRMNTYAHNAAAGVLFPVFLSALKNEHPQFIGGGQSLIRNAKVTSNQFGLLNEQRNQNVIGANMEWFQKSRSGKQAWAEVFSAGNDVTDTAYEATQFCPFFDYVRPTNIGTPVITDSVNHTAEIRVPMKHIDRFADGIRQFPHMSVGDLTYKIEFENIVPVVSPPFAVHQEALDRSAVASEIGSDAAPILYRPESSPAGYTLSTLSEIPFWVGMPVEVAYTNVTDKTHTSVISSLRVNPVSFELEIILLVPVPVVGATAAVTDISVTLYLDQGAEFFYSIDDVFIELHCIQLSDTQLTGALNAMNDLQIPYFDYYLVKKNLNLTTDYSETLQIDPGCAGVAVFTPHNNELISSFDNATSYRWSVDGKYTTDRDIDVGLLIDSTGEGPARQLYNHMLQKFFRNLNKTLRRFDGWALDASDTASNNQEDNHCMFPLVTPMLSRDVLLNFQLRSSANMITKEIFYLIIYEKVLNFKNGMLVR